MAFAENLALLEKATTSRRELVLLRMKLLQEDEVGLPALFVPLLKSALDAWWCAIDIILVEYACDEKKEETSLKSVPHISKLVETSILSCALQVHVAISRLDPTLAEEVGRQGSHVLLSRLLQYDGSIWKEEQDQDAIMVLQDFCCEIAALAGGVFPCKVAPFAADDLRTRLPLCFHIHPVDRVDSSDHDDSESSSNSQLVLINQVTQRQSAQQDVGFVMWPSAVALSRWLVSQEPHVIRDKTVLELGAGCGLTGLVATSLNPSSVMLTDFNTKVLENLERNIAVNDANATAIGLDFYQQSGDSAHGWIDLNGMNHPPVDLILAADIICQPEDAVATAKTIHDALVPEGRAIVICADAKHRFGIDCFEAKCQKAGLRVQTSNVADLYDGQLVNRDMEMTTAYVEGMTLTLFQIEHDSQR